MMRPGSSAKHGLGFTERHTVLAQVGRGLPRVPLKPEIAHDLMYI